MNDMVNLETRLETLGEALRSRSPLTDRVMNDVRQSAADVAVKEPSTLAPNTARRGRRRFFAAAVGAVATIGIAVLIAMTLFPSTSVGWDDVTKAIQAQKWIRGTATFAGRRPATMWLSSERQIWAYDLGDSRYFYNGPERVKYELLAGHKTIIKLPLGEDDAERVLSMNALSRGQSAVGHWLFGTEKVISQERKEVTEDGKKWVEFQMILWRGELNRATLRVDPETRLPVYLLLTSLKGDVKDSVKWQFDYPADGPADIYALGVPPETKIDDRVPSNDALAVLRAIAKSRKTIGDFRLLVGENPGLIRLGCVVFRKGDRWRVESYWNLGKVNVASGRPRGQSWAEWFEEQSKGLQPTPMYVSDGKTVWENSNPQPDAKLQWRVSSHTGPQDLMSGDRGGNLTRAGNVTIASLVFPDLSLNPGWEFSFDPQPADAPGCVVVKRSTKTVRGSIAHEWYYIDPAKGHAVVRAELFLLAHGRPVDPEASRARQSIRMEEFQQARQGFWYPAVVTDNKTFPANPDQPEQSELRKSTETIHYHFDFAAEMPDLLFTVDQAAVLEPEEGK